MSRPNIFEWDDYKSFLKSYFAWLVMTDRKYSLRWIAKQAKFGSPSMLSMVLSGDRALRIEKVLPLSDAIKLLPSEVDYLRLLVEMEGANSPLEALRIKQEIKARFKGGLFESPEGEEWNVFSFWYLPAVRELVALKNFKADPFWISTQLGITPEEGEKALSILLRIGLLGHERGAWTRTKPSLQPVAPPKDKVVSYMRQMNQFAHEALELDAMDRYYNSLTFSCSMENFTKIIELLNRSAAEADMIAESDGVRECVAQLQIQFFSLQSLSQLRRRSKPSEIKKEVVI